MTRDDQKKFVTSLCDSIKDEVIKKIESGKIPENWDGMEFRQLLKDNFAHQTYLDNRSFGYGKKTKRYREYVNTVIVNGI